MSLWLVCAPIDLGPNNPGNSEQYFAPTEGWALNHSLLRYHLAPNYPLLQTSYHLLSPSCLTLTLWPPRPPIKPPTSN